MNAAYHREWYRKNREKVLHRKSLYYKKLKKENPEILKRYRDNWNKSPAKKRANEAWRQRNPEKAKEISNRSARKNKARRAAWERARIISDPFYRLKKRMRNRVGMAFKHSYKNTATSVLVGGFENLKARLESLFKEGMSWENYGKAWEIDHITPLSWFDLSNPVQQHYAFHFTNCQPLTPAENRSKSNK